MGNSSTVKVYSLFGKSGAMEEIKPTPVLPIGCKIYCYGYAMSEKVGAIISEPDTNGTYKAVFISDYESGFFSVDNYTRPHSKKFGIGNYYDDNLETYEEEILEEYIFKAEIATKIAAEEEEKEKAAEKKEIEDLPKLFPHLTVNKEGDFNTTKKNLIAELKKHFPDTKFSVKKDYYSTYRISWIDGASQNEVEDIAYQFESYKTDMTGDFRDPSPSNFNTVFGGFKYIFFNRTASETVNNCKGSLTELLGEELQHYPNNAGDIFYRTFRQTSFPFGAEPIAIRIKENYSGASNEAYEFVFKEVAKNNPPVQDSDAKYFLVKYSEKAIAVFGETKEIKETLKSLGGRFNPSLTYNEEKKAGWIFSAKKENEIRETLSL